MDKIVMWSIFMNEKAFYYEFAIEDDAGVLLVAK